jgi:hypothetical protein
MLLGCLPPLLVRALAGRLRCRPTLVAAGPSKTGHKTNDFRARNVKKCVPRGPLVPEDGGMACEGIARRTKGPGAGLCYGARPLPRVRPSPYFRAFLRFEGQCMGRRLAGGAVSVPGPRVTCAQRGAEVRAEAGGRALPQNALKTRPPKGDHRAGADSRGTRLSGVVRGPIPLPIKSQKADKIA